MLGLIKEEKNQKKKHIKKFFFYISIYFFNLMQIKSGNKQSFINFWFKYLNFFVL